MLMGAPRMPYYYTPDETEHLRNLNKETNGRYKLNLIFMVSTMCQMHSRYNNSFLDIIYLKKGYSKGVEKNKMGGGDGTQI